MRQPTPLVRFGAPVVGFAYGSVLTLTVPHRAAPMWLVWAEFAIAATTAAGALFAYGLSRWHELTELSTVKVREVIWPVAVLEAVSLTLMNVPALLPGTSHQNLRGEVASRVGSSLVGMFAILAAAPAAGVMFGIWRLAARDLPPDRGTQVTVLLTLRRLLQRLLAASGSVVALVTFAAGTWWLLEHSLHTPFGNRPPQFALTFGAYGSVLVGVIYGPAWTALQRRGKLLCDGMFPLIGLDEAAVLSQTTDRQKLEQLLGLDRSIIADFQGGLIILAPLLASAVAAFLPH